MCSIHATKWAWQLLWVLLSMNLMDAPLFIGNYCVNSLTKCFYFIPTSVAFCSIIPLIRRSLYDCFAGRRVRVCVSDSRGRPQKYSGLSTWRSRQWKASSSHAVQSYQCNRRDSAADIRYCRHQGLFYEGKSLGLS